MRVVVVLALLIAARVAGADALDTALDPPRKVVGFDLRGKSKLKIRALRYLTKVEEGDYVRDRDVARITRFLINSELFEKVEVTFEPAEGGVVIVATVKDKHSWIVGPTFALQSGNRLLGVGFGENDFLGLNQKVLLYAQIGDRDSLFFGTFLDQNVRGTDLTMRFDVYLYRKYIAEYVNPPDDGTSREIARTSENNYLGGGALLGWNHTWWLISDLRLRGAYIYYGKTVTPDGTALTPPSPDGWDVTAQMRITADARHHHFGVTWGPYVQLVAETSIPGLDDYDYSTALLRMFYSWRLFREHQLEVRSHVNMGRHLPFHEELVLGGPIDLRGYALDQFRGDTRLMFRAEYSFPITKYKWFAFRAIGFFDSGYIGFQFRNPDGTRDYLATQGNNSHWFRNDVGVGLRIYVRRIVLPLLGFDVAYGIEGKAPEVYFQVGIMDF